jgi:hypothetical protein
MIRQSHFMGTIFDERKLLALPMLVVNTSRIASDDALYGGKFAVERSRAATFFSACRLNDITG